MKDLLNLVSQQGADELMLEPDRPPIMLLNGKLHVLDGPVITSDEVRELLRSITTEEQRRELDLCGDTRFTYATDHSAQYLVSAGMQRNSLSVKIKNLAH